MHSVVLKNDAVGDLVPALKAINNIISSSKKVTIFLSKLSEKYSFLVNDPKVEIKILNYDLNLIEKIKLIFFLTKNDINNVYILAPKNFYYYLPIVFKKIKFYAICINNINNYRRPSLFLRKFLFKYEINDREKILKRDSIYLIQDKLTSVNNINFDFKFSVNVKKKDDLIKYLPKKYIYFQYKKKICDPLGWKLKELQILFSEFCNYYENVVFTRDIAGWDQLRGEKNNKENTLTFEDSFNFYDFKLKKFIDNKSNVLLIDNIVGEDLFNLIKYSNKVVAWHGQMTSLGFILDKNVLDLWYVNINTWEDYRKYRNAFYEFKPKNENYDFTIPNKNVRKTIRKMKFSLERDI